MTIPDKRKLMERLSKKLGCTLIPIKRKQIMYEGLRNGERVVVCTPSSKIHVNGNGWFDLTTIQVAILDDANTALLAVRLEGNRVYIINFKKLRKLMTSNITLNNYAVGDHWKLFVWENHIQVQGNDQKYQVSPQIIKAS
ncbi:hypothetical protein [Neobacillus sp.]|uniref:hypothetical protein n=1 Tax=Neobacillus sp. TaxID=2675273 RepID=UPI002898AA1D|nr:hypothetical protein [Neobacillus sp.]